MYLFEFYHYASIYFLGIGGIFWPAKEDRKGWNEEHDALVAQEMYVFL